MTDPFRLLVLSSPSGAGKTTLCRRLLGEFPELSFSVSTTTRPQRQGETNGTDYHFVTPEAFDELIEGDAFAEWAPVHAHRYGTTKATIEAARRKGGSLLFDVDYQGAVALRQSYPDDTILCFVLPPSLEELERRIRHRGTEGEAQVELRLATARKELTQVGAFDYLIVNDNLKRAYDELRGVYVAEGCRRFRRSSIVQTLLK